MNADLAEQLVSSGCWEGGDVVLACPCQLLSTGPFATASVAGLLMITEGFIYLFEEVAGDDARIVIEDLLESVTELVVSTARSGEVTLVVLGEHVAIAPQMSIRRPGSARPAPGGAVDTAAASAVADLVDYLGMLPGVALRYAAGCPATLSQHALPFFSAPPVSPPPLLHAFAKLQTELSSLQRDVATEQSNRSEKPRANAIRSPLTLVPAKDPPVLPAVEAPPIIRTLPLQLAEGEARRGIEEASHGERLSYTRATLVGAALLAHCEHAAALADTQQLHTSTLRDPFDEGDLSATKPIERPGAASPQAPQFDEVDGSAPNQARPPRAPSTGWKEALDAPSSDAVRTFIVDLERAMRVKMGKLLMTTTQRNVAERRKALERQMQQGGQYMKAQQAQHERVVAEMEEREHASSSRVANLEAQVARLEADLKEVRDREYAIITRARRREEELLAEAARGAGAPSLNGSSSSSAPPSGGYRPFSTR